MEDAEENRRGTLAALSRFWQGPPAYSAATPWGPGDALLATGCIVLVADGAAGLIFGKFHSTFFSWLLPSSFSLLHLDAQRGLQAAALTGQGIVIVLILAVSRQLGGLVTNTLALRAPEGGWRAYVASVLLTFLIVLNVYTLLDPAFKSVNQITRHTDRIAWLLDGLASIFGASVSEELLFRAFLTGALARSALGYSGATILTSALWAALHLRFSLMDMVSLFSMGLFFSWLLWRTGSVRVPIICHACVGAFGFLTSTKVGF
jgi:CAAX protease family protein